MNFFILLLQQNPTTWGWMVNVPSSLLLRPAHHLSPTTSSDVHSKTTKMFSLCKFIIIIKKHISMDRNYKKVSNRINKSKLNQSQTRFITTEHDHVWAGSKNLGFSEGNDELFTLSFPSSGESSPLFPWRKSLTCGDVSMFLDGTAALM